jgi:predicted transcriptional regulator
MAESTPPDRIAITIEITPEQKARLERLAEQQGVSPDTAVRAVVERGLEASRVRDERGRTEEESQAGSFLDGLEHLVGSVEGPSDLSSNPDHRKGYGRS